MLDKIKNLLIAHLGDDCIVGEDNAVKQPYLVIAATQIAEATALLQRTEGFYFDFLSSISGVDLGVESGKMQVVYHIASIPYNHQFTLKVELERGNPSLPTVSTVWRAADWHERETFDLFGIVFEEHPDLRRILLPDDWEGYPLRKDYEAAAEYKGIKIN